MIRERLYAVQRERDGGPLVVREIPVPRPGRGEVLIQMAAAPINPSDLRFLATSAGTRALPVVPGLEGSGTIVDAGRGLIPRALLGRRVAFALAQGRTWAEYPVTTAVRCIPLGKHVSLEQGAMLIRHRCHVNVSRLRNLLRQCWSRQTSSRWSPESPSRGQCGVTALVLQDHCGGDILKTRVGTSLHFYNRLAGLRVDATADQFGEPPDYLDSRASREEAFAHTSQAQYAELSRRFAACLERLREAG